MFYNIYYLGEKDASSDKKGEPGVLSIGVALAHLWQQCATSNKQHVDLARSGGTLSASTGEAETGQLVPHSVFQRGPDQKAK